jgi:hypothetical protein
MPISGDYTYTVDGEGNATITGYSGAGGDIIIPSMLDGHPVVILDDVLFSGCTSLISVVIPDGVTTIGNDAFRYCTNLISVNIPDGVLNVGDYIFEGCTSLSSIVIPGSVPYIDTYTFGGCTSLNSVVIREGVTKLFSSAFDGCTSLSSIVIPKSITKIYSGCFYNCTNLTTATFMGNAPTMGETVFEDCHPSFTVWYQPEATGFTTPVWPVGNGDYPCFVLVAIDVQPQSQSVKVGNTLTLSVTAHGRSNLHYQWKKNGDNVGEDSYEYVVNPCAETDAGNYTVDVTCDGATITSDTAIVTISSSLTKDCMAENELTSGSYLVSVQTGFQKKG